MKVLFSILSIGISLGGFSQSLERSVIGSTGGSVATAAVSLDFTVGESVVSTETSATIILTQGFQQSELNQEEPNSVQSAEGDFYSVYPNPVDNSLFIEFTNAGRVSVTDANGKLVQDNTVLNSGSNKLDASNWSSGTYFLRLSSEQKSTIIKVIKP